MDIDEKILIETEQRSKSNTKRLDSLEDEIDDIKSEQKAIYEIASSVKVLVERVGHVEERVEETGKKVDAQTEEWHRAEATLSERIAKNQSEADRKTATNVNTIKVAIITAFFSAIITSVVAMLFR